MWDQVTHWHIVFFRYANILSDENPFLNDEGFGHQNSDSLEHSGVENDSVTGVDDLTVLAQLAPSRAKIFMFVLGMYIVFKFSIRLPYWKFGNLRVFVHSQ